MKQSHTKLEFIRNIYIQHLDPRHSKLKDPFDAKNSVQIQGLEENNRFLTISEK